MTVRVQLARQQFHLQDVMERLVLQQLQNIISEETKLVLPVLMAMNAVTEKLWLLVQSGTMLTQQHLEIASHVPTATVVREELKLLVLLVSTEEDQLQLVFLVHRVTIVLRAVVSQSPVLAVNTQTNRHRHVQLVQLITIQSQEWLSVHRFPQVSQWLAQVAK